VNVSALDLEQQHADALVHWTADLNKLEAEIADYTSALEEARLDAIKSDPTKRPGGVGTEVGDLTRTLDGLLKKRDSLARDIQAKKLLLERLEEQAEAEKAEAELQAAQEEIESTEKAVATQWASFTKLAQKLKAEWSTLAASVEQLDGLPGGDVPLRPFPGDLARAFELAIKTEDGLDPFSTLPRVNPKRLAITRTQGVGVTDTTGFNRTLRQTGDWA
jgi:hypothetical protein